MLHVELNVMWYVFMSLWIMCWRKIRHKISKILLYESTLVLMSTYIYIQGLTGFALNRTHSTHSRDEVHTLLHLHYSYAIMRDGVSNHQRIDCLLKHLFRRRSKKTTKLRVTGLCDNNSPMTSEFHTQMASNAENVSISWRHRGICDIIIFYHYIHIYHYILCFLNK